MVLTDSRPRARTRPRHVSTKERATHARILLQFERHMRPAHERGASLLLEEKKEDGSYCFPLGQKAFSDTIQRAVL